MEQKVTNVVNFGIGCVRAFSENFNGLSERVKTSVNELILDGEKSQSTAAVKMREMAGRATKFLRREEKIEEIPRAR